MYTAVPRIIYIYSPQQRRRGIHTYGAHTLQQEEAALQAKHWREVPLMGTYYFAIELRKVVENPAELAVDLLRTDWLLLIAD